MAMPETMDAATTRLLLRDHAEVVMRHIEDLQWTETFSDLTIHVKPAPTLKLSDCSNYQNGTT